MTDQAPTLAEAPLAGIMEAVGAEETELAVELLDLFLDESRKHVARMQAALDRDDGDALFLAAHSLGSSSATFGAPRLSALCRALEDDVRSGGNLIEAVEDVAEIAAEQQRVANAYANVRTQLLDGR